MRRPLSSRLGTAFAGLVFVTMAGLPGVGLHPLSHQAAAGGASDAAGAAEGLAHHAASNGRAHGGHASGPGTPASQPAGHGPHGHGHSPEECTCIGTCAGGAPPSLPTGVASGVSAPRIDLLAAVVVPVLVVRGASDSYLVPQPNPPPARG